jgi:hypothetical protein
MMMMMNAKEIIEALKEDPDARRELLVWLRGSRGDPECILSRWIEEKWWEGAYSVDDIIQDLPDGSNWQLVKAKTYECHLLCESDNKDLDVFVYLDVDMSSPQHRIIGHNVSVVDL